MARKQDADGREDFIIIALHRDGHIEQEYHHPLAIRSFMILMDVQQVVLLCAWMNSSSTQRKTYCQMCRGTWLVKMRMI